MTQIGGGAGLRPAQHLDAQIAVLFPPLWPKKAGHSRGRKKELHAFLPKKGDGGRFETRVAKRRPHVAVVIY